MESTPLRQASLQQLGAVPGVVGTMIFDTSGAVVASAFPPVFDVAGLERLAAQLSADGYFQEWLVGEQAALDLRYVDGHVVLRALDASWLLVLCIAQANAQLLSMSLTQVVRRLRAPAGGDVSVSAGQSTGWGPQFQAGRAPVPSKIDRLRDVVSAELGDHAARALEILAAAGSRPKDLLRATSEIEAMTRLFISTKKAEEIGEMMREILAGEMHLGEST